MLSRPFLVRSLSLFALCAIGACCFAADNAAVPRDPKMEARIQQGDQKNSLGDISPAPYALRLAIKDVTMPEDSNAVGY